MVKRKYSDDDEITIKKMCTQNLFLPKLSKREEISVLTLLRQGARKLWSSVNSSNTIDNQIIKCRICQKKIIPIKDSSIKCNFCEKIICLSCLVNCEQCEFQFCSFCAVNIYSSAGDIGRCLSCF